MREVGILSVELTYQLVLSAFEQPMALGLTSEGKQGRLVESPRVPHEDETRVLQGNQRCLAFLPVWELSPQPFLSRLFSC